MTPQQALRYHHNAAEIIESLENQGLAIVSAAEIERLQGAKRRALAIADERSKENVALRAALRRCRDMVGHPDNIAFIDDALEQTGDGK